MKRPFPFPTLDLDRLSLTALDARPSKVGRETLATSCVTGQTFEQFWESLPDVLAVKDLRALVADIAKAHRDGKAVAVGAGGHVIKTGLAPIVVDLMRDGIVNADLPGAMMVGRFRNGNPIVTSGGFTGNGTLSTGRRRGYI